MEDQIRGERQQLPGPIFTSLAKKANHGQSRLEFVFTHGKRNLYIRRRDSHAKQKRSGFAKAAREVLTVLYVDQAHAALC